MFSCKHKSYVAGIRKGVKTEMQTGCSVQFRRSVVSGSLWPHESQYARPPCPSSQSSLRLTSIESVMPSSHLIPFSYWPQSLPASGSFPVSQRFASGGQKYWSFSFSISPYREYPELISFTVDWLDLLAVQGTLRSRLQHHSSDASIFSAQPYSQSNSHIHTWPLEKP